MKFRLPLLLTAVVMFVATLAQGQTCNSLIIDKAGIISNPALIANAARPLVSQGADVHVVTVASVAQYGSNLEAVEAFIESKCPSWTQNGVRKGNLFVVMVAPKDKVKNIFLGSYYAGSFDTMTTYSNASNTFFKNSQWDQGLASALNQTSGAAIAFHRTQLAQQQAARANTSPVRSSAPATFYSQQSSSGISGFAIFMTIMFVLVALAVILYFVLRSSASTTTTYVSTTPDYSSSSYRSRSYGVAAPSSAPVSHTTVINNGGGSDGFVTGMLVGEALSRPTVIQPTYVAPSPVIYDTPVYVPDPPTPVVDAPDTSWESPAATVQADAPDTSWESPSEVVEAPSYDPPSYDPPSSDSGF